MKVNLEYLIDLSDRIGKNSYFDKGKALIIKNVIAFAPLKAVSDDGDIFDIGEEVIQNTNWKDLLSGRPVVEGHNKIDNDNLPINISGTVKSVRSNDKVIVDLIIYDVTLQGKIISGDLRSVSLSFDYDNEIKKVVYINHLGIVKLGQVAEAVINLENKEGVTMEDKEKILNLEKQVSELQAEVKKQLEEKAKFNFEDKIEQAKKEAIELKEKELEAKYALNLEAMKLGLSTEGDIAKKVQEHKQAKIKSVFGEVEGDVNTLFNLALKQEEKKKADESNMSLSSPGDPRTNEVVLGDILQKKATTVV